MNLIVAVISVLLSGATVALSADVIFQRFSKKNIFSLVIIFKTILDKVLKKRYLKKVEVQIPEAAELLSNSLKAGFSLQQAFEFSAENLCTPISCEFRSVVDQIKLGSAFEDAVSDWRERVPIEDLSIIVESILVLRKTGGNLIKTFDSVAETVRERQKVKKKVRTYVSQGVSQAAIIVAVPVFLIIGIGYLSPEYILPLFEEPLGWVLILTALILQAVGIIWIRKIVMIKV